LQLQVAQPSQRYLLLPSYLMRLTDAPLTKSCTLDPLPTAFMKEFLS